MNDRPTIKLSPRQQAVALGKGLGEVMLALSPWAPAPRPSSAATVTPEWLTAAFQDRAPGAVVEGIESLDGTTGTTDRRRVGLTWNAAGRDAGLPTRVFVKSTPLSARNRTMVAALDMAVNEVKFYRHARPDLGDHVAPHAYAAHAGHGARHLLVLEDISGHGGGFVMADECDLAYTEGIMRTLGRLHAAYWDSPRFASDLSFALPQSRRAGIALLMWQFRRTRTALLKSPDHELPPAVQRMARYANEHDRALYAYWEKGPLTLIHGDTHLGNTFRTADGGAGLLDWQVVGRAPGMREVSYFLTHSVPTELRRASEKDLIRLYLQTLAEHGVTDPPTFGQAWEDYRFFAFDAWDSVAICVVWPGLHTPANIAAGLSRANATIADLEVDEALRRALA